MRKSTILAATCGLLWLSALPAAAVPLTELQAGCLRNPKCTIVPGSGGTEFCIASDKPGGTSCETLVACFGDDSSQCDIIGPKAVTSDGRRRSVPSVRIETILQGSAP